MYDTHCHVLPELESKAADVEDGLQLCRISAEQGIKAIIATPHFKEREQNINEPELSSQLLLLNNELRSEGIEIMVLPGMEVYLAANLAELYEQGRILTLNSKNYLLIELPLLEDLPLYIEDVLFTLQLKGLIPVIAHPERCVSVIMNPNIVYELIERGCIIQIDSGSIEGAYGKNIKKTAYKLLKHNMVHAVATNNHASNGKISNLKDCYNIVSKHLGESTAKSLFVDNPLKIINGEYLSIENPEIIKPKRFWIL